MQEFFADNLPNILMLVIGFALMVVEMYIPGFGAPGILGSILLVFGVYCTAKTPTDALLMAIVIIVLLCLCFIVCLRSTTKGRLSKSKLILNEVSAKAAREENDLNRFVGKVGTARTILRPTGMADFDGVKLNVVSDGEFIAVGKSVCVERVDGNRILVREAARKDKK